MVNKNLYKTPASLMVTMEQLKMFNWKFLALKFDMYDIFVSFLHDEQFVYNKARMKGLAKLSGRNVS